MSSQPSKSHIRKLHDAFLFGRWDDLLDITSEDDATLIDAKVLRTVALHQKDAKYSLNTISFTNENVALTALMSACYRNLAESNLILGYEEKSRQCLKHAAEIFCQDVDPDLIAELNLHLLSKTILQNIQGDELGYLNSNSLPSQIELKSAVINTTYDDEALAIGYSGKYESLEKNNKVRAPKYTHSYIDIVGPSGVGKTTLCEMLDKEGLGISIKKIAARKVDFRDAHLVAEFFVFNPKVAEVLDKNFVEDKLTGDWYSNLIRNYMKCSVEDPVVILDEGFFNRVISIFSFSDFFDKKEVFEYLEAVPAPEFIIVLKMDCIEELLSRMNSREKGLPLRLKGLKSEEQRKILLNQLALCEVVLEYLKLKNIKHIKLDGSCTKEEILLKVKNFFSNSTS